MRMKRIKIILSISIVAMLLSCVVAAQENIISDSLNLPELKFNNKKVCRYIKRGIKNRIFKDRDTLFLSAEYCWDKGSNMRMFRLWLADYNVYDDCLGFFCMSDKYIIVEKEDMDSMCLFSKTKHEERIGFRRIDFVNRPYLEGVHYANSRCIQYRVITSPKRFKIKRRKKPHIRFPKYWY